MKDEYYDELYELFYSSIIEKPEVKWNDMLCDYLSERYRFFVVCTENGKQKEIEIYPSSSKLGYQLFFYSPTYSWRIIGAYEINFFFHYIDISDSAFSEAFEEVFDKFYKKILEIGKKHGNPLEFWEKFSNGEVSDPSAERLVDMMQNEFNRLYEEYVLEELADYVVMRLEEMGIIVVEKKTGYVVEK